MADRLGSLLLALTVIFGAAGAHFFGKDRMLKTRIARTESLNSKARGDLAFLRSLPPAGTISGLEDSFLSLAADIAALQEMGGTLATVAVDQSKPGQPISALAERVEETEVMFVPIIIRIKEYRYFDGLIEAILRLGRRDILIESINYQEGLRIEARLFGRKVHGKS